MTTSPDIKTSLFDARQHDAFDEQGGGRWITFCDTHGTFVQHETRSLAREFLNAPDEWCEHCAALIDDQPIDDRPISAAVAARAHDIDPKTFRRWLRQNGMPTRFDSQRSADSHVSSYLDFVAYRDRNKTLARKLRKIVAEPMTRTLAEMSDNEIRATLVALHAMYIESPDNSYDLTVPGQNAFTLIADHFAAVTGTKWER